VPRAGIIRAVRRRWTIAACLLGALTGCGGNGDGASTGASTQQSPATIPPATTASPDAPVKLTPPAKPKARTPELTLPIPGPTRHPVPSTCLQSYQAVPATRAADKADARNRAATYPLVYAKSDSKGPIPAWTIYVWGRRSGGKVHRLYAFERGIHPTDLSSPATHEAAQAAAGDVENNVVLLTDVGVHTTRFLDALCLGTRDGAMR